jgi:hypothetical protein
MLKAVGGFPASFDMAVTIPCNAIGVILVVGCLRRSSSHRRQINSKEAKEDSQLSQIF